MTANQVRDEFISLTRESGERLGFGCRLWIGGTRRTSRNIIDLSGSVNCLVYFKVRSELPYRWGVTLNRLDELRQSGKGYVVVLLFESPEHGYLLTSADVGRYGSIWPLGSDGDYKVETGSYLQFNTPFQSFGQFIDTLQKVTT